ncbi:MAG: ABC transporter substrate-binding protein [Pseudomonadota bacterium]
MTMVFNNNNKKFRLSALFILTMILIFLPAKPAISQAPDLINIAAIFSLTGQGANGNKASVLGTRLAINEINAHGGLLGHKLNLILIDNMSTPIGSDMAARQAINAGVAGIIGAQWSSHSLAIAHIAQKNKIPMISNYSTHPDLTSIGDYIFRVCYTDNFQGKVMAEFASKDLNALSAVIFVDLTSDYSLELSRIFHTHFESLGGIIATEIEYKAKDKDFSPAIEKTLASKADVIFFSGHDESGVIAYQLQQAGTQAVFLGGDGLGDEAFLLMGGRNLKKAYFCSHWSEASEYKESKDFINRYQHLENIGTGAALAYDAAMMLGMAIEKAGTTKGSDVRRALFELEPYPGVTGPIKFDIHGNPIKSAIIMEIKNGQPHYLKTIAPN